MWKNLSPLRHPLFPELKPARAADARGTHTVLAGTFHHLLNAGLRGATATRAVFLVRRPGCHWISDAERDMLWRLFEVPVFGLLVDDSEEVMAYECEAQVGMHLCRAVEPGRSAHFESAPCVCGRAGQRLVPAARIFSAAEREFPVAV